MSEVNEIAKLNYIRKVTGFANLGVLPTSAVIERAASSVKEITESRAEANLSDAQLAIEILSSRVMPSQAICQAGMRSVDNLLAQLREGQLAEQNPTRQSTDRPH